MSEERGEESVNNALLTRSKEATQTEFAGLSCKQERFVKKRQKRGDIFLKKTVSNKVSYNAVKTCKPLENFMVFEEEEEELPEEETV